MSRLDIAGVLGEHARVRDAFSYHCACNQWRDKRDDGTGHRAHVAAVLTSHLGDWLGSEEVREAAAQATHAAECTAYAHEGQNGACYRQTRAALAALGELLGGGA